MSHVCGIGRDLTFQECCLGSGPIKNTCNSLHLDYDESLWQLFCFELNKYVQTESIAGVPYRKMSKIGSEKYSSVKQDNFIYNSSYKFSTFDTAKNMIFAFTKDFLKKKKLKFNYFNDSYGLGMSFLDYMLTISNDFIEWYNKRTKEYATLTPEVLYNTLILQKVKIANNSIYLYKSSDTNNSILYSKLDTKMFTFKGKDILFKIIDDSEKEDYTTILNIGIATTILDSILKTFNYNYNE